MMTDNHTKDADLLFEGSLWCNMDVALRNLDQVFRQWILPAGDEDGVTVIEWYILRALYERDGQHASELARAVGRAATSFTPNLDKLQKKGYIERQPDKADRRAVKIYLTEKAQDIRQDVVDSADKIDTFVRDLFSDEEYLVFQRMLLLLQHLQPDEDAV